MPSLLLAQVGVVPGITIRQTFDQIGSGATAPLPAGWKADNLTAIRSINSYSGARTTTTQSASTSMTTHGAYNFGSSSDPTDRAIGGLATGSDSKSVNLYAELQNNSAGTIRDFTISYQVEKYRNGTNTAGFSMQLFYSKTGEAGTWLPAGDDFKTSFAGADPNNNGSGPTGSAPLLTVAVTEKQFNYTLAPVEKLYLAWNYSVTTGTTTTNAQALGVDDIVITANDAAVPVPTISAPTFTAPGPYCASTNMSVSFTTTGTYQKDNLFKAELSDENGHFAHPTATSTGVVAPIMLAIPANARQGSGYKVRVVSSGPIIQSQETEPFAINAAPTENVVSLSPGSSQTISTTGSGTAITASALAASAYQWFVSSSKESGYTPVPGAIGASYTPQSHHFGPAGTTYYVLAQATALCGGSVGRSQPVAISVALPVTATSAESIEFGFADIQNSPAFPIQNLTVQGNYLAGPVTVSVPANSGFRLRIGNMANFVNSVTLAPAADGTLAGTQLQIRFEPNAIQSYHAQIRISTAGVADKLVRLTGAGSERPVVSTAAITPISGTSAIAGGLVSTNPADAPVTVRGLVYGTSNNNLTANWSAHTTTTDGAGSGAFQSTLANLTPSTTYFARAYATNGAGTAYGATVSFTTPAVALATEPTMQSALAVSKIGFDAITLTMTGGNGAKRIVLARQGSEVTAAPADATTYPANNAFGAGAQIGSGNFVAYAGSGDVAVITGLAPNTAYHFAVYEFNDNNTAFAENYLANNPGRLHQTTAPAPGQLIFEENFEDQPESLLTGSGWSVHSGSETNAIKVTSSGLFYTGYGSSGIGHATYLNTSGQDINKSFETVYPNTPVYTAFLVNVASATTTGDFFLHYGSTATTQFRSRVFAKSGTVPGTVQIGISGSTNTGYYAPQNYPLNTTLLVVVRFDFDGTGNSTTTLYVNPQSLKEEDQQAGFAVTETPASNSTPGISSIALRQGTASLAPRLTIDGIRVATSYEMALGNPTIAGSAQPLAAGNYHSITVAGEATALVLKGPVTVHGTLTLTSGNILSTADELLTISSSGTISGGSAESYIQGPLKLNSSRQKDELFFPIGSAARFSPVRLNLDHTGQSLTGYTAAYLPGAPASRTLPAATSLLSEEGHYNITSDNPNNLEAAFVTLPYGTPEGVEEPWNLRILKSDGNKWIDLGGVLANETSSAGLITSYLPFNSFSDFVLASSEQISLFSLPVELTSFTARRAGQQVELRWETAMEKNNRHFEVQRSSNGQDFNTISLIPGKGNTTMATPYAATDPNPLRLTAYYRLKQVDLDGAYSFSSVLAVEPAPGESPLRLHPNPTRSFLHITIGAGEQFEHLEISDMMGQVVLRKTLSTVPGSALEPLDVSSLANGGYVLTLHAASYTSRAKFIKFR
ncbi:T9SS type A sorting domain-containing protein [Pontibacter beigongshangensis]|uniref:T9SS type A sorting domain-containing protein n=1 Tax=Pontibacter beigongshangensis TaxID=2574733 RepID=UPI00165045FF|nr:T9SS type A sorting domain-containing protein [Pontibacter beigongshangensis]